MKTILFRIPVHTKKTLKKEREEKNHVYVILLLRLNEIIRLRHAIRQVTTTTFLVEVFGRVFLISG